MNIRANINLLLVITIAILGSLALYWGVFGARKVSPANHSVPAQADSQVLPSQALVISDPTTQTQLPALHDPNTTRASSNESLTPEQAKITGIKLGAEHEQTDEILRDVSQMNAQMEQLLTQDTPLLGLPTLDAKAILKSSEQLMAQVDAEYGLDSKAFGQQWQESLAQIDDPQLQELNEQRRTLDEEFETIVNSFQ